MGWAVGLGPDWTGLSGPVVSRVLQERRAQCIIGLTGQTVVVVVIVELQYKEIPRCRTGQHWLTRGGHWRE